MQLSYIWMDRLICVIIFLSMIGFTECYGKCVNSSFHLLRTSYFNTSNILL